MVKKIHMLQVVLVYLHSLAVSSQFSPKVCAGAEKSKKNH